MPIAELELRLNELPPERAIVAYCRGPYCVFSDEAITILQARGYRALHFPDGLPDWRAAGFPVEINNAAGEARTSP
jgi:rhodanese-related sulfurtransferase